MPFDLHEATLAVVAFSALLLLPGLVIVRASWPYVPFLSLAFWVVSWGWLPPTGAGRERFLQVSFAFFALLAGLRLLKPQGARPPSGPTLAVVGFALLRFVPFWLWLAPPGRSAGMTAATALLLTWRDGIPSSMLPLLPVAGLNPDGFGAAALAADLSLLTGIATHRALLFVSLAAEGLLVLSLFAFARRYVAPALAAPGTLLVAALALVLVARSNGDGGATLSLAFGIAGASLVLRGAGRSTLFAAGLFWGAALVTVGLPGGLLGGLLVTVAAAALGREKLRRLALASTMALALAAPTLWKLAVAFDPSADLPVLASSTALSVAAVAGLHRLRVFGQPRSHRAATAAALILTLADWKLRGGRVAVTVDDMAAAKWIQGHTGPTEVVCARDEASRAWMPVLAGRRVEPSRSDPPAAERGGVQRFGGPPPACRIEIARSALAERPASAIVLFQSGNLTLTRVDPRASSR